MKMRQLCGMVLAGCVAVALCGALPAGAQEIKLAFTPRSPAPRRPREPCRSRPSTGPEGDQRRGRGEREEDQPRQGGQPVEQPGRTGSPAEGGGAGEGPGPDRLREEHTGFCRVGCHQDYGVPTFIGATNANLTKQGNPWLFPGAAR